MFDPDLTIRALAGIALALFLTPALRPLGLPEGAARFCRLAGGVTLAIGIGVALGATVDWFFRPR
ncbi:hypothetical protein [Methylosinus sp. Ce-a6]|uniref:hypothetical protein n=1 Tax=Methylosinus sp. Ce-a6 TaxID=2172005 RepID=UPI00135A2ABB|nr:hypothetical protein [Methylosinus sp. Ce-a6]